jgi:transposase
MPDFRNPVDCEEFKALPVSNNYLKTQQEVAKLHEKVAWQRKDWLHKLSRELANNFQYIAFEDIDLQVMAKKRKNSGLGHGKVVGDQGFGMLRNMIAYKGNLVKVNPKNTSKTCHCCGFVNPEVVVGVNKWKCPNCSAEHDRDINAALNILFKYNASQGIVGRERAESTNACGAPSSAVKHEVPNPSSRVFCS